MLQYIFNRMVDISSKSLDAALHALSDATRRAMLVRMAKRECTVSELAAPFDMSVAAVSKHLQVLERANLLKKVKEGRTIKCSATLSPLHEVTALLEQLGQYWQQQLDSLERFLSNEAVEQGAKNKYSKKRSIAKSGSTTRSIRKKRKSLRGLD